MSDSEIAALLGVLSGVFVIGIIRVLNDRKKDRDSTTVGNAITDTYLAAEKRLVLNLISTNPPIGDFTPRLETIIKNFKLDREEFYRVYYSFYKEEFEKRLRDFEV